MTVCAGEPEPPRLGSWDAVTGFADSSSSIRARKAEDRTAFAGTVHRLSWLDLVDGQYEAGRRPPGSGGPIEKTVSEWLALNPRGVVAVPAGAGEGERRLRSYLRLVDAEAPLRHADHLFVRDVALRAIDVRDGIRVLLYEELPYLWARPADDEVARVARKCRVLAEEIVVAVDRRAKVERIASYATQSAHLRVRGRRVDRVEDIPASERYWLLR